MSVQCFLWKDAFIMHDIMESQSGLSWKGLERSSGFSSLAVDREGATH